MQLVEQHVISKQRPALRRHRRSRLRLQEPLQRCQLRTAANLIHTGRFISYNQLDKLMQSHKTHYRALPAKVAQWVLKGLVKN